MIDIEGYERIVKMYGKPLFRYCYYRLMQNKFLAEETLNDVYYVLYKKWDVLEIGQDIRAYLYRVADMCIKNNYRRYVRYYKHTLSYEEEIEKNNLQQLTSCDTYFEDHDIILDSYIEQIMGMLSEPDKQLFACRYINKKTIAETSELSGIPYSTLRLRLVKIEKTVRDMVKMFFL